MGLSSAAAGTARIGCPPTSAVPTTPRGDGVCPLGWETTAAPMAKTKMMTAASTTTMAAGRKLVREGRGGGCGGGEAGRSVPLTWMPPPISVMVAQTVMVLVTTWVRRAPSEVVQRAMALAQ